MTKNKAELFTRMERHINLLEAAGIGAAQILLSDMFNVLDVNQCHEVYMEFVDPEEEGDEDD